ncbi:glycosyltransferase [Williamsia sp. CHRR-6]|uniref:glycosyltransferase n=1 Tax=Williamsia sp. CHRR-6 TaxID=2835871 RepID=UPI001BD9E275|nr:glycosyltransferase [Williamsia sp. CHRR-6]MBT0566023.1 glycosyltransferase family 1 protein [Williamsia sp. CHRR-6]
MRILFVVPPLTGHINPTIGVGQALIEAGHEVAWAGHQPTLHRLHPQARIFPCGIGTDLGDRTTEVTGIAALRFLWEEALIPLAEVMAPDLERAIDEFEPDVMVCDQQAFAGSIIAEHRGIPYLTSATTSAELTDPFSGMPKVGDWVREQLAGLRTRIGITDGVHDPRFSPHGIIAFTTEDLAGTPELAADRVHFVGPSFAPRPPIDFDFSRLDDNRRLVLVSLGTVNGVVGERFLNEALAAADLLPEYQLVIVDPMGVVDHSDPRAIVVDRVPQLELLPLADAVVCHGGHNTVCESLWHGVPLVVAPIRDDQPVVAAQVAESGTGLRVRFGRITAAKLAESIVAVSDPLGPHTAAARRVATAFQQAGGAQAAADAVLSVVREGNLTRT